VVPDARRVRVRVAGVEARRLGAALRRDTRPVERQPEEARAVGAGDAWRPVAPVAELQGAQPLARTVRVEQETGWSQVIEEHPVLVLPQDGRVLSAVCPHEGCTVVWRAEERGFLCPCHDSRFDAAGARTTGPAARGLEQLPAQVENGVLKIRWQAEPTEPAPAARG
jgi:Rieske Fe-S protein